MQNLRSCSQLLQELAERDEKRKDTRLPIRLLTGDDRDVYNISAPFEWQGKQLLLGRVEERCSENSYVVFFQKEDGVWLPDTSYPSLHLQDPFRTVIENTLIVGGVETFDDPETPGILSFRTIFCRMEGTNLVRIAKGPDQMKDIRLLELAPKKILVFTRPRGNQGGRGTIGWKIISSLEELTPENLSQATLLDDQFIPEEWGGANEMQVLKNGLVGVLSHIARFDESGNRHYYSSCFCFNPVTGAHSPMKLLAVRHNFQDGASKRPDLEDVVFSGGLVRNANGTITIYCGVGDAEAHCIVVKDPFLKWENLTAQEFGSL